MNTTPLPRTCHDEIPKAAIKSLVSDFRVDEVLGFDPANDGEHLWVNVRKSGVNTRDVIELIARTLAIAARDIGYSGLKDRHAITTQWFSIPLAKVSDRRQAQQSIQHAFAEQSALACLRVCCSRKKLKPGTHLSNRFTIILRDINSPTQGLQLALEKLKAGGFPNYFGAQRFGHQGLNVEKARSMFQRSARVSRFKRGIYLSAARAYLFNLVLARRVQEGSWDKIIDGELCILDGTHSVFPYDTNDIDVARRCREFDLHPSGPLHGRGALSPGGRVAAIESVIMAGQKVLSHGLENAGLKSERRALRALPSDLHWNWQNPEALELSFTLQRGVYATSLLSEIAQVYDASKLHKLSFRGEGDI